MLKRSAARRTVSAWKRVSSRNVERAQTIVQPAIIVTRLVQLFMRRRHFIGQSVLVSAILDSKVYRSLAYQSSCNYSAKRRDAQDIALGGEAGYCTRRSPSDTGSKFRHGISFPFQSDSSLYYVAGSHFIIEMNV